MTLTEKFPTGSTVYLMHDNFGEVNPPYPLGEVIHVKGNRVLFIANGNAGLTQGKGHGIPAEYAGSQADVDNIG